MKKIQLFRQMIAATILLVLTSVGCAKNSFEDQTLLKNTQTPNGYQGESTLVINSETQTSLAVATAIPSPSVSTWKDAPVIPESLSPFVAEIFQRGKELNNNSYSFSVIGDCDSTPSWFLGDFDRGQAYYSLGEYDELELVISAFQGSFNRDSYSVKRGFNTAAVLSPLWADQEACSSGESPLECEIRLHHPSFAFILLGTNDAYNISGFERNLRTILDFLIENGIVPILATKADNLEGDYQINEMIFEIAKEYQLPLWNFWKAVQPLPDQGLQADKSHLTWAKNYFDDPFSMQHAWPVRNLTALQMLDLVWRNSNGN